MVRLTDIAQAVNLDVSVVSRALSPRPDRHAVVKEETRLLIQETARKLGYRPNRQASFLKKGGAATILCFLPDVADRLIADLMMGISETACHENFPVNFFFGSNAGDFGKFIRQAEKIGHSGIITYPPVKMPVEMQGELNRYHQHGGKILLLNVISNTGGNSLDSAYRDIPQLNIDDFYGGQLVARHFLERGCRKFYRRSETRSYANRSNGFTSVVEAHGFPMEELTDEKLRFLKKETDRVGIFAEHDFIAYKLLTELSGQGIRAGEKVLVAGFDDQVTSIRFEPSLTTVHQPTRREGRLAMEKLIQMIYGGQEKNEMLKPYLVIRESTGGKRLDPEDQSSEEIIK